MTWLCQQKRGVWLLMALLLPVIAAGCSGNKEVKKDPFFEKWKVMAKESRGATPVLRAREIRIPEEPEPDEYEKVQAKPLPENKITLKMSNADIDVVLRILARAANQNILIKSEVQGQVSVDFKKVPWKDAFLSILRSRMLTYVWEGDIIRIVTVSDIKSDLELESIRDQRKEQQLIRSRLAPLLSIVVPINYADPVKLMANIQEIITKDVEGKVRGSVRVSEHTNSLIIQASRDDLKKIVDMIETIDRPTPQILIEANIVEATSDTARSLGVQWGGRYANVANANTYSVESAVTAPLATTAAGSLSLFFGKVGGSLLDMQLLALQKDGKLNILSRPSITTLDNQTAFTENGEKVPYLSTDADGNREVKFEDAVLRLEITPHVIDGENIKMKIIVQKDEVDTTRNVEGNPYIYKKQTDTTLIVKDGETIVISGLSKRRSTLTDSGVPGMKDIPLLGYLFKGEDKGESMEEVLIFITPSILKPEGDTGSTEKGQG